MGKKSRKHKGKDGSKKSQTGNDSPVDPSDPAHHSPTMIFYPERTLNDDELATAQLGAAIRGAVGHNTMFEVVMAVYEKRLQDAWMGAYASGSHERLFEGYTPILLALHDAGIAQNSDESYRDESTTLASSERRLRLQLTVLEHRLGRAGVGAGETFLFVPLEAFYCNLPHQLIERYMFKTGVPPNMLAHVMRGYTNVEVFIHMHGPCINGETPPKKDLIGPHVFNRGLRFQNSMTSSIAIIFLYGLLKSADLSPADVFVFPHGLVFASEDGDGKFEEIINRIGSITPSIYHCSEKLWYASGKATNVKPMTFGSPWDGLIELGSPVMLQPGDEPVKHVDKVRFMDIVKENGCSWYPLFSADSKSSLVA